MRTFAKIYKDELKLAAQEKRVPKRKMGILKRGRPLLLGKVDKMVRRYLSATQHRGGLVHTGSSDKRTTTVTFTISHDGDFLPG